MDQYSVISKDDITLEFLNSIIKDSNDPSSKIVQFTFGSPLEGGFVGYIAKISLVWSSSSSSSSSNGRPNSVILKSLVKEQVDSVKYSALVNSNREVDFYNFKNQMNKHNKMNYEFVPKVYYTNKISNGSFSIIMQDLSELTKEEIENQQPDSNSFEKKYITACKALGNQCWGLPSTFNLALYDPFKIFQVCFLETSKLHIEYFRDSSILQDKTADGIDITWLKNHSIYNGTGKDKWEENKKYLLSTWSDIALPKIEKFKDSIKNVDLLLQVVQQFYGTFYTWDQQLKRIDINNPKASFTLTHGDFHAGNVMIPNLQYKSVCGLPNKQFYLIDWSEIGINCPFADLAQFIISNCNDVEFRRANEIKLFKLYWDNLIQSGKVDQEIFTFDYCFDLYKSGGIERWIVLNTMMSTMVDGDHFIYFINQLSNFIMDHYNLNTTFKLN